jgi:hypothetical protein
MMVTREKVYTSSRLIWIVSLCVIAFIMGEFASGEEGKDPYDPNEKIAAFLQEQGMEVGLTLSEAQKRYGLTTPQYNQNTQSTLKGRYYNPGVARLDKDLHAIPYVEGFYSGYVGKNNTLLALKKCISIMNGEADLDAIITDFVQKYPGNYTKSLRGALPTPVSSAVYEIQFKPRNVLFEVQAWYEDKKSYVSIKIELRGDDTGTNATDQLKDSF